MIEAALMSGFTAVGMDVFLLGPMPTPAVAMLTRSLRADLGVMISASHNPFDDNGIKLFDPDGYKLSDEIERRDRGADRRRHGRRCSPAPTASAAPRASKARRSATSSSPSARCRKNLRLDGLRIVIDCANGAGYKVAPEALWELGAEVIKIGVEPNGRNINEKCGSTAPEALVDKVREVRADIGIALDGDADRVVIVDEKGNIVDGDQLMAVIAESWHRRGKLTAGGVVATVMSNLGLERYLKSIGLDHGAHAGRRPLRRRAHAQARLQRRRRAVGPHRAVRLHDHRRRPRRRRCRCSRCVVSTGKPVSEVCNRFEPLPQILKNVRYASGKPLEDTRVVQGDRGRQGQARRLRPPRHPPIRHRAGDPRHGRGRRRASRQHRRRRHRRGRARRRRRLTAQVQPAYCHPGACPRDPSIREFRHQRLAGSRQQVPG